MTFSPLVAPPPHGKPLGSSSCLPRQASVEWCWVHSQTQLYSAGHKAKAKDTLGNMSGFARCNSLSPGSPLLTPFPIFLLLVATISSLCPAFFSLSYLLTNLVSICLPEIFYYLLHINPFSTMGAESNVCSPLLHLG